MVKSDTLYLFLAAIPIRNARFGEGDGIIWLDDVSCAGDEMSLQSCPNLQVGAHNCDHDEDAGVVCSQGSLVILKFTVTSVYVKRITST